MCLLLQARFLNSLLEASLFCVAVDNWLHFSVVGGEVRKLKALGLTIGGGLVIDDIM